MDGRTFWVRPFGSWVLELVAEQVNNLPPNPDLAAEYYNRALGYTQAYDWQLTIGDYTKAIKLGLSTNHKGSNLLAWAYLYRGYSYANLGEHQTAIDDYTKAIQLDPDYARAYKNRGLAYSNLGQTANANADDAKACSLDSQWC